MSKPVILITGASTGIGRATALAFALPQWVSAAPPIMSSFAKTDAGP